MAKIVKLSCSCCQFSPTPSIPKLKTVFYLSLTYPIIIYSCNFNDGEKLSKKYNETFMEKWRFNSKCETTTLQLVSLSPSLSLSNKRVQLVWLYIQCLEPSQYLGSSHLIHMINISIFNHINLYINKCQEFYIIIM